MTSYEKLYDTRRWRRRSARQLRDFPICQMCELEGVIREAHVAHHIDAHKGDEAKFFFGELASVCKYHHDGECQQAERKGFTRTIGADGWPKDARHPVYIKR